MCCISNKAVYLYCSRTLFSQMVRNPYVYRYEGVYMVKKQDSFKEEMEIMKKSIERDKGIVESINKDDDSYDVLFKKGRTL